MTNGEHHLDYCELWKGGATCSCGHWKRQQEQNTQAPVQRHVPPLGMTDAEFLRTLRIRPEEWD